MKIVGCGALGPAEIRQPIDRFSLDLTGTEHPNVLVIGTPKAKIDTFDEWTKKSLAYYAQLGVEVDTLYDTFDTPPTTTEVKEKIGRASLINISGGDTLRAMGLFDSWGVAAPLKEAANNGAVLTGTSAGAIIWFTSGHSDSMSYRAEQGEAWDYMFMDALGVQPGLICPHYNTKTEGGEMRATNLARMIGTAEAPITVPIYGIDNRAAIVVEGLNIASLTADDEHRVHNIDPVTGQSSGVLPVLK